MMNRPSRVVGLIALQMIMAVTTAGQDRGRTQELSILNEQIATLYRDGKFAQAIKLTESIFAQDEARFGPGSTSTGTLATRLAPLDEMHGPQIDSDQLKVHAAQIIENAPYPTFALYAASLTSLAAWYEAQGRYAKAESLYKLCLAIREKRYGGGHPDVGASLNDLAALYEARHKYGDAEALYKRSIKIYETALGPEHINVGAGLNNLAALYESQGRHREAETIYWRAVGIFKKELGPTHPHVSALFNNLAVLYQAQNRYTEAEDLYQRALSIGENALGPNHPHVKLARTNLAAFYRKLGRDNEAEVLEKQGLQ